MSAKRKIGLGKGLSSLLGDSPMDTENEPSDVQNEGSFEVNIDEIEINPFQPRTHFDEESLNELAESIRVQGVIQPIAVRKTETGFQLISGERRLQASRQVGLKTIPAYVREATDVQMLELGLIENIQRENLNPMEISMAYKRLLDECGIKQEELGARVGKDRSTVNNYLRLLNLPEIVQEGLAEQKLSMGHARALLGIQDETLLVKAYHEVVDNGLSVRKVEELVKTLNAPVKPEVSREKTPIKRPPKRFLEDYQKIFSEIFDKKVVVQADENDKGEIKILYNSREELMEIIERLKK